MTLNSLTGTQKLNHASGLYLEGIRDGNVHEALKAHTGARYTQHSTGVGDGPEGFAAFFEPFLQRNPIRDIRIIRALEDGKYVFLHVVQDLNNGESQWVTGDLFETDTEDRVIEHWDVIQSFSRDPESGLSMIDGTCDIEDLERTEDNKAIIEAFCRDVLIAGQVAATSDYFSPEGVIDHKADGDERSSGFSAVLDSSQAADAARYWKVHKLIGQGNFVVTLSHVQIGQSHYCCFDLFRLEDGKIREHWDVGEKILAPEEWNNQGKF